MSSQKEQQIQKAQRWVCLARKSKSARARAEQARGKEPTMRLGVSGMVRLCKVVMAIIKTRLLH